MRLSPLVLLLAAVIGCGSDATPDEPSGDAVDPSNAAASEPQANPDALPPVTQSGDAEPQANPAKPIDTVVNSIGMKFKLIPAGEFLMGSPLGEKKRFSNEKQHRVRLTESFYLGAHEVTQADYEAVMGTNPSFLSKTGRFKDRVAGKDTRQFPVDNVSWYDAVEFCNKLSSKESLTPCYSLAGVERGIDGIKKATVSFLSGTGYRLPTEAEWEYACRAGTQTPFSFGSVLNGKQANVNGGEFPYGTATKGPYLVRTERVGQYGKNAFGLCDMHGNVWEWCQDAFDHKAYESRSGITQNPLSTTSSESKEYRVLRGGSWGNGSRYAPGPARTLG